ncbi:biogenesis of lysosome-related organelles complex 1 subunit 5 isoform X3 [Chlorocebus sabaeus]|uniref:biogenesis of lysosome-related organelles complex 1 subunit 5 isoform X3 n=1 Tax=Chlorocebus sabaeus TaxID=60711 RepID=UPI00045E471A|nr:biogenesis of lysosome-related organelles complex 1 subunit 5 isoform X2 [Chlorocebus sabaeus]
MSGGGTETPVGCEAAPGGGSKKRDSLGTAGSAHLIIKDLGEIHSRLLDHRPVIQGETRYFVKEFECKQLMIQSVDSNRGNRNEKSISIFSLKVVFVSWRREKIGLLHVTTNIHQIGDINLSSEPEVLSILCIFLLEKEAFMPVDRLFNE